MIQGNVVSVTRTVFAVARKAMQRSDVTRWDEVQDDSDDELHMVMCSVRGGEKSAPMLCDLEVQQEPVEFETDTGFSLSWAIYV